MSEEREREMMTMFAEALKKMNEFERGRFLGRAEGMADAHEAERETARAAS